MSLRNSRLMLALAPSIVVFLVALIALTGMRHVRGAVDAVSHTRNVMSNSDAVLKFALDAETGDRAYAATGDTLFLEPVHGAKDSATAHLGEVRSLTVDNPAQQQRVVTLGALLEEKFQILKHVEEITATHQFTAQGGVEVLRHGKMVMDSAREVVKDIQQAESALLTTRQSSVDQWSNTSVLIIIIGGLAAVGVSLLVNIFLARLITERDQMTRELTLQLRDFEVIRAELAAPGAKTPPASG